MKRFDIVDSQIHLFLTMDIPACLAAMDSIGVQAVIIDEFWGWDEAHGAPSPFVPLPHRRHRPVAPGAQMASMRHPDRFSYLLRVDHFDPELEAVIRLAGQDPSCRAIRIEARTEAEVAEFTDGAYQAVFEAAAAAKLPVFVLAPGNAPLMTRYLEAVPDCLQIIDHIGLSGEAGMFDRILELARYPNAVLKWSHPHRTFDSPYPFDPAIAGLRRAIEAFGASRIMWGSDFTAIRAGHRWADALYYLRDSAEISDDEKEWILGRTLRTILDWPAPAAAAAPELFRH